MSQRSARAVVAWSVVAALGAALAVAALAPAGAQTQEPPAEETARGDTLYTTHCARCHGAEGRGGLEGRAPSLRGMEVARVDLVLRTNRMPPAREDGTGRGPVDWDDQSREALLAHLTALFDLEGGIPSPLDGDPARGREVYATNCAACHGYTGAGGVAGAGAITPTIVGLDEITIAEAIRVGPFQMPRFAEQQISDEELDDVVAYLGEVAAEEATPLNLVELNPVFASAFVAGLALVVLLSCVWIGGRVTMFPDRSAEDAARTPGTGGEGASSR